MTEKEAEEIIFEDGQPVFRNIDNINQMIESAINWQRERMLASAFLKRDKRYAQTENSTGKAIQEQEDYTLKQLVKLNEISKKLLTYLENIS